MLTLYDYLDSGNGYKARLLLSQLDRDYRWVELDILANPYAYRRSFDLLGRGLY